jgi:hypothetical protein
MCKKVSPNEVFKLREYALNRILTETKNYVDKEASGRHDQEELREDLDDLEQTMVVFGGLLNATNKSI